MRFTTRLENRLKYLSHGSQGAVQNGETLSALDVYMHVERPIEKLIKERLRSIQLKNGGLLLLVGSAGDGKSHIISQLKGSGEFNDFCFHNDATEGCSPTMTAVETLKYILSEFSDDKIDNTTEKLLVAINLGKLFDLLDDLETQDNFKRLINVGLHLADNDISKIDEYDGRIHVVTLTHQQCFEMDIESETEYPFDSKFMSQFLDKIVSPTSDNPFYQDFIEDMADLQSNIDPVLLNYLILQSKAVRNSLVKLVIEASLRFKLVLTPRDFLDFVYSIIVPKDIEIYEEARDFFRFTLTSLVFECSENKIQKALSALDPMKICSLSHDKDLSELYATFKFNPNLVSNLEATLQELLGIVLNRFYQNNDTDKPEICKLLFRLKHLLNYHSENEAFKCFIKDIIGCWKQDVETWERLEEMVLKAIPRHYGSYIAKENLIPLNIQGPNYKLFATLNFPSPIFNNFFSVDTPHVFEPTIRMTWEFEKFGEIINCSLSIDYDMYVHLFELSNGKLATSIENENNNSFGRFVREITKLSTADSEVKIIGTTNTTLNLSTKYKKLQIQ